ncbi:MAG TPA: glucoamylase family protein [Candidatus Izemoplasmatales bacterium]|nr:glucoamylase family protein [Candidatus Izemoplasmatales bacterium]
MKGADTIKRNITLLFFLFLIFAVVSCATTGETTSSVTAATTTTPVPFVYDPIEVSAAVLTEERLSFKFFWEAVNGDPDSPGYGMITDRYHCDTGEVGAASIASIGFGLSALLAGVENGWVDREEAEERALGTLQTLQGLQRTHGFFYHFLNMHDGGRSGTSEVSIIDTALLICGAITVGEYFGGEIQTLAVALAESVEWDWYYNETRMCFYMGYSPGSGFSGYWDMYAEQLMVYILAAGSAQYSVGKEAYYHMKDLAARRSYGSSEIFYTSPAGTLFTYQFAHAWFDSARYLDKDGIDWFENSRQASIAAHDYAVAASTSYRTLSDVAWGLTASDGPDGYKGNYGNLPSTGGNYIDGTLAPCGAIGSMPFVPELVIPAINHYASLPRLQSKYGFRDAYNLGLTESALPSVKRPNAAIPEDGWYNPWVIGIDKGIEVLMIENYRSGLIWHYFMQSSLVRRGLTVLEFVPKP